MLYMVGSNGLQQPCKLGQTYLEYQWLVKLMDQIYKMLINQEIELSASGLIQMVMFIQPHMFLDQLELIIGIGILINLIKTI